MPEITLKDILIGARQEAHRMRHYYIGAEHLFIALLSVKGSITSALIQSYGLTPEYVIDSLRRKIGKGSKHRLWAGVPYTPRTEKVMDIARRRAKDNGRDEVQERDVLLALLDEHDSLPVRVLRALGMDDAATFQAMVQNYRPTNDSRTPYVKVEFGAEFSDRPLVRDQLFILRRMFYEYNTVRVERRLTGGYSKATLLVATPMHVDGRQDAPVVVKIDHVDAILDEARRYELNVKSRLPTLTARLEDKPIAPETSDLAGIKYTLVSSSDSTPRDLRTILNAWDAEHLGQWLREALFPSFAPIWWKQNKPFRFQVWREYDWLLPPILTLEKVADDEFPADGRVLSLPLKRSKLQGIEYGEIVSVRNFIVQKVYPERNAIQLAAGHGTEANRAYKIEFRNVNMHADTYYRGEVIENIIGRVWQTRHERLLHAVRGLEPDFDPKAEIIPAQIGNIEQLPNPIIAYEALLETYVNGTLSTIHGDLHPGNIMIGPNESAFLIDFANTRDGHTIFDWATLEIGLLSDSFVVGDSWTDALQVLRQLHSVNRRGNATLKVIQQVREIVQQCLATPTDWTEYYIALAFCALRAMMWQERPLGNRRLMFLVAALALHELQDQSDLKRSSDLSTTDTDVNDDDQPSEP